MWSFLCGVIKASSSITYQVRIRIITTYNELKEGVMTVVVVAIRER